MKIGTQFFTIRDYCRTPEALDESLKRVADIGYRHIHFDYNRILRDPTGTIRFHDVMGCRWIGIGSNPRGVNPEGLAAMAAEIKPVLPALIAGGHRFMYHNHHMEFARFDGKTFLDLLCETFTPEECGVTLDTYWVQAGGGDPAYWLRRLSGRVDCVHFKDMVFNTIIQRNIRLSEAPSHGKPIILYDVMSNGTSNYLNLAKEVLEKNGK